MLRIVPILMLIACGCGFTAVRTPTVVPEAPSGKLGGCRVSVATGQSDADEVVELLRATRLFGEVGRDLEHADLVVTPVYAREGGGCGTPLSATYLSLGLVPSTVYGTFTLSLDFESPRSGKALRIDEQYGSESRHGLWAFFLRAGKKWKRYGDGPVPRDHAAEVRETLQGRAYELTSLLD